MAIILSKSAPLALVYTYSFSPAKNATTHASANSASRLSFPHVSEIPSPPPGVPVTLILSAAPSVASACAKTISCMPHPEADLTHSAALFKAMPKLRAKGVLAVVDWVD
ncbi:hypothetical protein VTO73DRAFT_15422 [Trametes versicolor]